MNNKQHTTLQEDEIDLRELWATLIKRKLVIIVITMIATGAAAFYTWKTVPVYKGEVLIEVGEIINDTNNNISSNQIVNYNIQPTVIFSLDSANNLKEIIIGTTTLNVDIPAGTTNILRISSQNTDPFAIKSQLQKAVDYILKRHQEKIDLYKTSHSKIRMTQIIGEINVSDQPIKPKKQLIITVALISGLILGIFSAFLIEFLSTRRNR